MILQKKKTMKKILLVTLAIVLICVSPIYALKTETHEAINEYIARNTLDGFSLDLYLKDKLGIQEGIEQTFFNSNEVWQWLREGGLKEDKPYWYMPYLRSANHFHNPLTDQGFSGIWGTGFISGESSIQWSQEPIGMQSPGGYYSWHDVRNYFYKALTSESKTDREKNFADTFRGVGQLMHLVEDLSVPEHTRDDGHYVKAYEAWVGGNVNISSITPKFFDSTSLGNSNPLASVPVANLFDTNQYNGTNPDIIYSITLQGNIGLSEYTNANFLSPDTMFSADFPYPDWSNVVEYDEEIDVTTGKKRRYLKKLGHGEKVGNKIGYGESIDHLAASRWFYKYLPSSLKHLGLELDEKVYTDYAAKLIPRAVGYPAGLLNYFFRGEINMVPDDVTGSGYVIVNNTEEAMDGAFQLYYDDTNDMRKQLWSGSFALGTLSSGNNQSSNITFIQPNDAKEPCKYILVFKGQMGNEQDAVVGKVLDDIVECVTGRLVRAHYSNGSVQLRIWTESGYIEESFDLDTNREVISVRFNVSNHDEFVVATISYSGPDTDKVYTFHKFTVDEPNLTVNYNGIVLTVNDYPFTAEYTTLCEYTFLHPDICTPPVLVRQFIYQLLFTDNHVFIQDFYYNANLIKPFGKYEKYNDIYITYAYYCNDVQWYSDSLYTVEEEKKVGIYYNAELDYTIIPTCTGGALPPPNICSLSDKYPCTHLDWGIDMVEKYFPIAIFNSSGFAYAHFRFPYGGSTGCSLSYLIDLVSPVQFDYWPCKTVKTMLRKDNKESFYYSSLNGYKSYSYELGTFDGRFLINSLNNRSIGWNSTGSIVECERVDDTVTCETLKQIGGLLAEPFDVSVEIKE